MRSRGALTLGFGLAYVVLGVVLFLRELDVITLRWAYLGPVILVLFGAALIAGGLVAERLRPAPPAGEPTVLIRNPADAAPVTPPESGPGPDADRPG